MKNFISNIFDINLMQNTTQKWNSASFEYSLLFLRAYFWGLAQKHEININFIFWHVKSPIPKTETGVVIWIKTDYFHFDRCQMKHVYRRYSSISQKRGENTKLTTKISKKKIPRFSIPHGFPCHCPYIMFLDGRQRNVSVQLLISFL